MSHNVRRVKIGRLYDGSSCCCCSDLLFLDDDAVICEACGSPTHIRCWNKVNRCVACNRAPSYVNQPLPQTVTRVEERPAPTLAAGENFCATCGDIVSGYCFRCSNLHPQPAYTGPRKTLPEANNALTYAVVSLFCFGFVLGPVAIVKATAAKRQIAADPRWDGEGTATAAQILGIVGTLLSLLYILRLIVGGF